MALKPPLARYREKNPNIVQLLLFLLHEEVSIPILPSDSLSIKLEIRQDPKGRLLELLTLTQEDAESDTLTATLPDLVPGLYYVDLRVEPASLPPVRSGLCQIEILPIGSLELISDVVGLSATLDQRNAILSVQVDESISASIAAVVALQTKAEILGIRDELVGVQTDVNENKESIDLTKQEIVDLKTDIDDTHSDITEKGEQVDQNAQAIGLIKAAIDLIYQAIGQIQQDVIAKQELANTSAGNALTSENNAKSSETNAHTSETNSASYATSGYGFVQTMLSLLGLSTVVSQSNPESVIVSDLYGFASTIIDNLGVKTGNLNLLKQVDDLVFKVIKATSINGVRIESDPNYLFSVQDDYGFLFFAINLDGSRTQVASTTNNLTVINLFATALAAATLTLSGNAAIAGTTNIGGDLTVGGKINGQKIIQNSTYPVEVVDDYGFLFYALKADGTEIKSGNTASSGSTRLYGPQTDYDLETLNGQSNSVARKSTPPITTTAVDNIWMAKGVVHENYTGDPTLFAALVPAREGDISSTYANAEGPVETALSSAARKLKQKVIAGGYAISDTSRYDQIIAAVGSGGQTIAQLSKGTANFTRNTNAIANFKALANAQGKTFSHSASIFIHGEQDTSNGTDPLVYRDALRQLRYDVDAYSKSINPVRQTNDLLFYVTQVCSHNFYNKYPDIGLVQADLCDLDPNFIFLGPTYQFGYADQLHYLNPLVHLYLGHMYAIKKYQYEFLGVKPTDLKPIKAIIDGNTLEVTFSVAVKPLVLDTTQVTNPGNYGFRLYNAAKTLENTPVSTQAIKPDTLRMVWANPVQTTDILVFAINGTAGKSGNTEGSRGCVRDSQGLVESYSSDYAALSGLIPLHNWLRMFSIKLQTLIS